ncbi:rhomboid family intramembrane serine protease [Roseobacter sp. OBYS 0001]|uniref:rhomboid family intramembrane serine protease n=1 Tax=Roseobacter sp. OBYS 0001 TaxID=882651 RepID=UPI001C7ECF84|nr:rhomboid family intramembrane serine protease [Roseobacter sp. OBYS 0001]
MAKDSVFSSAPGLAPRTKIPGSNVLLVLIAICCALEFLLQLSDFGLVRPERLRGMAYEYGGFWPGLLKDWNPNFALQPYAMFLSYGFLHGGVIHLIVNMFTLWSLGAAVLGRVGVRGFSILYVASILGGAAGYAVLAPGLQPMVGASGALFGLAGGVLAWMYVDRFTFQQGLLPIAQAVALLIALNLILWWAMSGQLAWQTHLGGFIAGWITALLIDPRPFDPEASKTS